MVEADDIGPGEVTAEPIEDAHAGPPVWQVNAQPMFPPQRLPYHRYYETSGCIVVTGRLAGSHTQYPIVLDTGAVGTVFVNDIHMRAHRLPIIAPAPGGAPADMRGLTPVRLDGVSLGAMYLQTTPCWYVPVHRECRAFHITIHRDNAVILGLPALRAFSYVLLDSRDKQVEFGGAVPFRPQASDRWSTYPLRIAEDDAGYSYLVAEIPIAGRIFRAQLDTGSGRGLLVTERRWKELANRVRYSDLQDDIMLFPYMGSLHCRHGRMQDIRMGDRVIPCASVSVFADDSLLCNGCDALLGMQWFRDVAVVLDFHNHLLWVSEPSRQTSHGPHPAS